MRGRATGLNIPLGRVAGGLGFFLMVAAALPVPAESRVEPLPEVVDWEQVDSGNHADRWNWQMLPSGLIYHSYLAGMKEPRHAVQWVYERNLGWRQEVTLGGRVGLLRYGNRDQFRPEGWQTDFEGAAMPRIDLEESLDLKAVDFRCGLPITYGHGPYQTKLGYYHVSSHLGDEMMIKHPQVPRINYTRDALIWGHSYYATQRLRLYGEAACALNAAGGAEPWEFQFGCEYRPDRQTALRPTPFFAINGHLHQELDFSGNLTVETGWAWCGPDGHLFRMGMIYFTGKSEQYQFFRRFEDKLGLGIWYDY